MRFTQKCLRVVSWVLVPISPLLFQWIPSAVRFGKPPGDDWLSMLFPTAWAALPFIILAGFVHMQLAASSGPNERRVTLGLLASITSTIVFIVVVYALFWCSDSMGVNFGLVLLVLVSPALSALLMIGAYLVTQVIVHGR